MSDPDPNARVPSAVELVTEAGDVPSDVVQKVNAALARRGLRFVEDRADGRSASYTLEGSSGVRIVNDMDDVCVVRCTVAPDGAVVVRVMAAQKKGGA